MSAPAFTTGARLDGAGLTVIVTSSLTVTAPSLDGQAQHVDAVGAEGRRRDGRIADWRT